ncbi:MAG TPA: hypothetical protein P5194_01885 [Patescibacteria group bacterium]|jgi:hypothetical protein|nr:hypothetical protein [bacterium]HRT11268.1 hypothetical protein [Patescibacteria group bacterium]HRU90066.1 hypothetical protein [Patescibacteria group bacterium]
MKKINSSKNARFNPRDWKPETRYLILWLGVTIIMLILLIFWFYGLRSSLIMSNNESNARPLLNISQIQSDLSSGIEEVKSSTQALKKINTSTQDLTPEEKLLEEQNKIKLNELRQKLEQLPDK